MEAASGLPRALPSGFAYFADVITPAEERALIERIATLPFTAVVMRGFTARRRTVHFGVVYGFDSRRGAPGPDIPDFLLPLRARVAGLAELDPAAFTEALVTEYAPGAVIGWHRDAPMFGPAVLGLSLGSSCRMRFRRTHRKGSPAVERASIVLAMRSAYVIQGPARAEWQHSIPAVEALRYSITFRSVRRHRPERPSDSS